MNRSLAEIVVPHADRDEVAAEMTAFYGEVDRAIAAHRPTCWNRGACCRFGQYGHRLFVTSPELAFFVRGMRDRCRSPSDEDACPYQVDGLCTAREHRPLGCRIFFCDPAAQGWQPEETEAALSRLKALAAALGVEYRYVEWLSALRELNSQAGAALPAQPGDSPAAKPAVASQGTAQPPDSVDPRPLTVIQ